MFSRSYNSYQHDKDAEDKREDSVDQGNYHRQNDHYTKAGINSLQLSIWVINELFTQCINSASRHLIIFHFSLQSFVFSSIKD